MHDDDDAKAILKRRARYAAMALAGMGTVTQAACGPCLAAADAHIDRDAAAPPDAPTDAGTDEDAR